MCFQILSMHGLCFIDSTNSDDSEEAVGVNLGSPIICSFSLALDLVAPIPTSSNLLNRSRSEFPACPAAKFREFMTSLAL